MAEKAKVKMEDAILDITKIQEALENNTKGIIRNLLKEEVESVMKKALNEAEYDEEDIEDKEDSETTEEEPETDAVDDTTDGKETEEDSDEEEISLTGDETDSTDSEDDTVAIPDDTEISSSDTEEMTTDDSVEDFEEIDTTGMSDEEVIEVFKKLKDSDELETVSDNEVKIKDEDSGNEYIVKTGAEKSETPEMGIGDDTELGLDDELGDELGEESDTIYEVELTEDKVRTKGHDSKDEVKAGTSEQKGEIDDAKAETNTKMFGTKPTLTGGEPMKIPSGKKGNHAEHIMESEDDEDSAKGDEKLKKHIEKKGHEKAVETAKNLKGAKSIDDVIAKTGKSAETGFELMDETSTHTLKNARDLSLKPDAQGLNKMKRPSQRSAVAESVNKIIDANKQLREEIATYKDLVTKMRGALNEMVVDRTNLIHVTRLFTENATTQKEKESILKRFDQSKSVDDSKGIYKVIAEELKNKKPIKEAINDKIDNPSTSVIKSAGILKEQTVYIDKDGSKARMLDLMNKMSNSGKE